ncbi:MAG: hypothetical protein ABIH35_01480 [Patescibacteria group bacterium]
MLKKTNNQIRLKLKDLLTGFKKEELVQVDLCVNKADREAVAGTKDWLLEMGISDEVILNFLSIIFGEEATLAQSRPFEYWENLGEEQTRNVMRKKAERRVEELIASLDIAELGDRVPPAKVIKKFILAMHERIVDKKGEMMAIYRQFVEGNYDLTLFEAEKTGNC